MGSKCYKYGLRNRNQQNAKGIRCFILQLSKTKEAETTLQKEM